MCKPAKCVVRHIFRMFKFESPRPKKSKHDFRELRKKSVIMSMVSKTQRRYNVFVDYQIKCFVQLFKRWEKRYQKFIYFL
jgi:hypothetical protein